VPIYGSQCSLLYESDGGSLNFIPHNVKVRLRYHVRSTFLFGFTEHGVMFVDGQQSDVVVVDDVLRVLETVVGAQKVVERRRQ